MNKIVLIGVVVVVVLIAILVVLPFLSGHGGSSYITPSGTTNGGSSYITPSEAASVIGGNWTLQKDQSYYFTVSNGVATVKYFNGTTTTESLPKLFGPNSLPYAPTGGMGEQLKGTVNGQTATIGAGYLTFSDQSSAEGAFSYIKNQISQIPGTYVQNVSSNEFISLYISSTPGSSTQYEYGVVKVSGNTVYLVSVTVPVQLSASQLETLVNYLG